MYRKKSNANRSSGRFRTTPRQALRAGISSLRQSLREWEGRYRIVVQSISDLIFIADKDGRVLNANPAALKALGLSGIRPPDFRRTFIAMHVEAGTHPKLVQESVDDIPE